MPKSPQPHNEDASVLCSVRFDKPIDQVIINGSRRQQRQTQTVELYFENLI